MFNAAQLRTIYVQIFEGYNLWGIIPQWLITVTRRHQFPTLLAMASLPGWWTSMSLNVIYSMNITQSGTNFTSTWYILFIIDDNSWVTIVDHNK